MRRAPQKKQLGQEAIPTTSLADMMFLLLIFLIVTTSLTRTTGFISDMPSGSKTQQQEQDKMTSVSLTQDRIMIDDREITIDALREYLKSMRLDLRTGEGKVVVVSAGSDVRYQNYYETLAVIQACGGMVALLKDEEEKK